MWNIGWYASYCVFIWCTKVRNSICFATLYSSKIFILSNLAWLDEIRINNYFTVKDLTILHFVTIFCILILSWCPHALGLRSWLSLSSNSNESKMTFTSLPFIWALHSGCLSHEKFEDISRCDMLITRLKILNTSLYLVIINYSRQSGLSSWSSEPFIFLLSTFLAIMYFKEQLT